MRDWSTGDTVKFDDELSTLNTSESLNVAEESSLSQILLPDVPLKYYLSSKACQRILRRAEAKNVTSSASTETLLIQQSTALKEV